MSIKIKHFALLIAFLATASVAFAQNTGTNSPYGRYGFGILSNPAIGASEAMGGISYGLRRSQGVNPGNPASFSALDTLTFIFDFGVSVQQARMSDGINQRNFFNGNLDYVAIQFPLWRNMGASVGLLPFSRVGYNFGAVRPYEATQFSEVYRGTGGLSRVYAGAAWELFDNFSVGANVSFLFGSFTHTRTGSPLIPNALVSQSRDFYSIRALRYDIGVQQTIPLSPNRWLTFGAVYTPRISTTSDVIESRMQFISDPFQNPWQLPMDVFPSDTIRGASFQLPHQLGAGFTFNTNNLVVGLDGEIQLWDGLNYPDALDQLTRDSRFNNTFRLATGIEYVRNPIGQHFRERIRVRGGLSFGNSYTNVRVYNPQTFDFLGTGSFREYGATFGVGLPFRDFMSGRVSMINIGLSYTRKQPTREFMIAQDMFMISVNMNINELWFRQHRFQ